MSSIAFKRSDSSCNYDDSSATNPCLKNGTVSIRKTIGLADQRAWEKEWRPIFMNFIESAKVTSIDLTRDRANSKNELRTKIREFIDSVRDETASDVPDEFLEAAIFILVKDLKAQVAAANKAVQIKEGQMERTPRLTSHSSSTPRPTLTPAPASAVEDRAVPLSGRTPILLRRTNRHGVIRSLIVYWSHLAVFPPSVPPNEHLPEVSTWKISVVHRLFKHLKLWDDKELIYWIDPNGNPLELASDLDLGNMVFAAQSAQETMRARQIVVKASDREQVQWDWTDTSRRDISVRDPVEVKPSFMLKRPSNITFRKDEADDPLATSKKVRSSKPASFASGTSSVTIRGSGGGRKELATPGNSKHNQSLHLASEGRKGFGDW